MAYKRYKKLQQYINGEPQDVFKKGEVESFDYNTVDECNGIFPDDAWFVFYNSSWEGKFYTNKDLNEYINIKPNEVFAYSSETPPTCYTVLPHDISKLKILKPFTLGCELINGNGTLYEIEDYNKMHYNGNNLRQAFASYALLTSLDLSNFDTSNVTDMKNMFVNCEKLKFINLSSFDTSNVTDMSSMFRYCYSLENINLSSFDTSKVTDMSGMFYKCRNLTEIKGLENFNISKVIDMSAMFNDCSSLESIDLSKFDPTRFGDNSDNYRYMFDGCYALKKIKCTQTFKDWCESKKNQIFSEYDEDGNSHDYFNDINWEIV